MKKVIGLVMLILAILILFGIILMFIGTWNTIALILIIGLVLGGGILILLDE